jgi:hypothetical protein
VGSGESIGAVLADTTSGIEGEAFGAMSENEHGPTCCSVYAAHFLVEITQEAR